MCIYRNNRNLVTFSHHVETTVNQLNKVVYLDIKSMSIKAFGFIREGVLRDVWDMRESMQFYGNLAFSVTVKGKVSK